MNTRIRLRQDYKENWERVNPVLLSGEPGIDQSTRRVKFGDGTHKWNELPFMKIGSQFFNFYVSSNGDDTWDGDEGAPLHTLRKALELAAKKYSYTCESASVSEVAETFLSVVLDDTKVFVGDYFTSGIGYGVVADITDGVALVYGNFDTTKEFSGGFTTSRRCTILCADSTTVTEDLEVPPFCEIVNEGFMRFSEDASLSLQNYSYFDFINRGTIYCEGNGFLKMHGESAVANAITLELGMSTNACVVLNSLTLSVKNTLSPSECNVNGAFGTLDMSGCFSSYLNVDADSASFDGNYSLSGVVSGSASLYGKCKIHDSLTLGADGKTSVILCPVEGKENLTIVGDVKDINSI